MSNYFVGMDLGTTGCRAVLFDGRLHPVAAATREYPVFSERPGWAEQDPDEIVEAALQCATEIAELSPGPIAAVGLSSVCHSIIAVDRTGQPLTRSIIWGDTRSEPQAQAIRHEADAMELYRLSGCVIHPMYWPAKVRWLRDERPEVLRRAHKLVSIKEYFLHRLFGHWVVDESIASSTGIANIRTLKWEPKLLDVSGLSEDLLSELATPLTALEGMLPQAATRLGKLARVPFVVGAGDGALSSLGSGATQPYQATAMIGTSGAVRLMAPEPKIDPRARTWCYYVAQGRWISGGAVNNGGIVYRWLRDKFFIAEAEQALAAHTDPYDDMNRLAAAVGPGAAGLLMLPFHLGERNPGWNANARGVLFGLNLSHGREHLARAVMEGVAFRLRSILEVLEDHAGRTSEVRAAGGFTRSPLWLQIVADVFQRNVMVPTKGEASAAGAAVLAMVSRGHLGSIDDISRFIGIEGTITPNERNAATYEELYGIYRSLCGKLGPEFAQISDLQRRLSPE